MELGSNQQIIGMMANIGARLQLEMHVPHESSIHEQSLTDARLNFSLLMGRLIAQLRNGAGRAKPTISII